jgi:hypothetical protein
MRRFWPHNYSRLMAQCAPGVPLFDGTFSPYSMITLDDADKHTAPLVLEIVIQTGKQFELAALGKVLPSAVH